MPQYLSPGVYVEEVPSAVKPIAGAGTSTAAFVGQVLDTVTMPAQPGKFVTDSLGLQVTDSMGKPIALAYTVAPAGAPQLITSWESFKKNFGDFQSGNVTDGSSVTAVTNALAGFRAIDEISIVAVPGAIDAASQAAVIAHCQNAGDRFAILDSQITSTLTPAAIQGSTGNSNYAAMYFPRIQVFDPVSNGSLYVAPSGHMAGIYARVDTQRGVHKAPANEVVLGAVGLEARLGKADQDGLNPAGINVIRNLNGNITVWGARTLGGDANLDWKYINVRRLFLFLRDSIDAGTQWVVFEPNDLSLCAKITRNVSAFLTNVWRSGALFGATAPEAFYVRCDATTNPPEVRDLGQVVTEIGVAVVKPAEFVIFRISQWAGPGK